jgi:hypothetical protein
MTALVTPRLLLILLIVALTGCSRSPNALDWEVEAPNPHDFDRWVAESELAMPEEVYRDFVDACNNILSTYATTSKQNTSGMVRLTKEINGLTIRDVTLRGLAIKQDPLERELARHANTLVTLTAADVGSDPEAIAKHQRLVDYYRRLVAQFETQVKDLQAYRERIAQPTSSS